MSELFKALRIMILMLVIAIMGFLSTAEIIEGFGMYIVIFYVHIAMYFLFSKSFCAYRVTNLPHSNIAIQFYVFERVTISLSVYLCLFL